MFGGTFEIISEIARDSLCRNYQKVVEKRTRSRLVLRKFSGLFFFGYGSPSPSGFLLFLSNLAQVVFLW